MKYINKKSGCLNGLCDARFHLPCEYLPHIYFHKEWFAQLYGEADNFHSYQSFVSFDGGKLWKRVPFKNFDIRYMNGGGIIAGVNITTKLIVYSFDEGKTYYHISINPEVETIVDAGRFWDNKNERLFVFGQDTNKTKLIVTTVDFTNLIGYKYFNRKIDRAEVMIILRGAIPDLTEIAIKVKK
ncbi:Vacuolar protein sorting/targeting protein 10 [Thelohanellus kitauei]|uniref:Vacuolar protein sorting/targeting protein 10 n=1 Tax=Thelohanellus kitauei TaxID=669202 RepID=A0A0C2J791_THEKT|nr:Vacuolar protein sorting/targeting protein 10 [Thelohanellus kitauei]